MYSSPDYIYIILNFEGKVKDLNVKEMSRRKTELEAHIS